MGYPRCGHGFCVTFRLKFFFRPCSPGSENCVRHPNCFASACLPFQACFFSFKINNMCLPKLVLSTHLDEGLWPLELCCWLGGVREIHFCQGAKKIWPWRLWSFSFATLDPSAHRFATQRLVFSVNISIQFGRWTIWLFSIGSKPPTRLFLFHIKKYFVTFIFLIFDDSKTPGTWWGFGQLFVGMVGTPVTWLCFGPLQWSKIRAIQSLGSTPGCFRKCGRLPKKSWSWWHKRSCG